MKTNEFKNLMGMYGLEVEQVEQQIYVTKNKISVAIIHTKRTSCCNTNLIGTYELTDSDREEVVDLVWEYAGTDVEQRVDEKKARLRLDVPLVSFPWYLYKNKHTGDTGITGMKEASENYQTEFTVDELLGLNQNGFKLEVVG